MLSLQVVPPADVDVDVKIKQEFQDEFASCQAAQGALPQLSPGGTTLLQPQPQSASHSQSQMSSQQYQHHTLPPTFPGNHMAPYPNLQMSQCSSIGTIGYEPAPAIDVKPQISLTSQLAHMPTISPTALPTQSQTSLFHHSQFTQPHSQGLMMDNISSNMGYHSIPNPLAQSGLGSGLCGTLPGVHEGHMAGLSVDQIPGMIPLIPEPRMMGHTITEDPSNPVPIIGEDVLEMQRALILAYEELNIVNKRVSGIFIFKTLDSVTK